MKILDLSNHRRWREQERDDRGVDITATAERQVQTPGSLVDSQPHCFLDRGATCRLPVKTWKGLERVCEAILSYAVFELCQSHECWRRCKCTMMYPSTNLYSGPIHAILPSFEIQGAIALLKAPGKLRSTCRGLTPQRPFTVDTCDNSWRKHFRLLEISTTGGHQVLEDVLQEAKKGKPEGHCLFISHSACWLPFRHACWNGT